MFRISALSFALVLMAEGMASGQDPQAVMNELLRQQMQQRAARQQNEMMRLELERRDLERKLQLSRASDRQVWDALTRYCPAGNPPCPYQPPDSLLDEAERRGLITLAPRRQPRLRCETLGDGMGGGITDCY